MLKQIEPKLIEGQLHPTVHIETLHPDGRVHRTAVFAENPDLDWDARMILTADERAYVLASLAELVGTFSIYVVPADKND
jgi:hypothetical protein